MTKYHVGRGKLVSKKLKFPLAGDHAVCLAELDTKQYFMLLNMVNDLKVSGAQRGGATSTRAASPARAPVEAMRLPLTHDDLVWLAPALCVQNNYSLIYDMILKNMDKIQKVQDLDSYQNMY